MLLGGLGAAFSIANTIDNFGLNREKYYSSVAQWNAQQGEARIAREREDNAVQRRVADLKMAGLSPVLAAGSSAASAPILTGTTMPSGGNTGGDITKDALILRELLNKGAEYDKVKAETNYTKQLTSNEVEKNANIKVDTYLKQANIYLASTAANLNEAQKQKVLEEARAKFIDNEIALRTGQNVGGPKSIVGGNVQDFMNYVENAINSLKGKKIKPIGVYKQ